MLILLPLLLLFLSALVMVALSFQPKFGYHWPVAFNGAFLAWISIFILRINLPRQSTPTTWRPDFLFDSSPTLLADEISWPFALAVATLTLAVILTDVVRLSDSGWSVWAGCLVLGGFGIMAVFAGNPLTLVMSWMFIDIVEMAILLARVQGAKMRRNVVLYTAASMIGTMLVFFAQVLARAGGGTFTFDNAPQNISLLLLVAVGLRLGVLPLNILYLAKDSLQRSLGTMLHLIPAAASLVLLVRISVVGIPAQFQFVLLALLLLAALYGAIAWARVRNELVGRPYWILAMTALAIAASMRALPGATLAWSLALLYA
ncbi:MAG: hypothetical protein JXB38_07080, partial [Anaerolineales bacterium]|nr:hypothetical protein [Anaerolineales bacterium]